MNRGSFVDENFVDIFGENWRLQVGALSDDDIQQPQRLFTSSISCLC